MTTRTRKLEVVIAGDASGAIRALGDVDGRAGRLGRGMGTALRVGAAGFTAIAAGGAVAGAALFEIGTSFDDAYDRIRIGTGATGAELETLKNAFRGVVADVPATFEDASTAIAGLNSRLGLSGPRLESVAEPMLELTRLTGGDIQTNVAGLSRVFGDWNVDASDMPATLDEIFRASQSSGAGIESLSSNVVQFGAPLRQMGFSLEESLALFGTFEAEGVNIGTVLGGMRRGLAGFAQAGEAPADALARVTDQIQNAGSTAEANRLAIEVFGTRAGPDMAAAIREGRFELDELTAAISGGSETIMAAGEDTKDFGEKWQEIKNRVFLALEPVAVGMFDAIGSAMDTLGPIAADVGAWLGERLPGWIETGRRAVEALRPTFENVLAVVRAVWPDVQRTVASALSAVGGVVSAVVSTVTALWRTFGDDILQFVRAAWNPIRSIISGVLTAVSGVIRTVLAVIRGDWGAAWNGIKSVFSGVWTAIKGVVRLALAAVRLVISAGVEVIGNIWEAAWRGISRGFTVVWNAIKAVVRGAVQAVRQTISTVWNGIRSTTSTVWNAIKRAMTSALDGMKGAIRTARDVFRNVWNTIKGIFRAPIAAVLRVVVNPFLGFLNNVASLVGIGPIPHNFSLPGSFHSGGVVPGSGEVPAVLLGGEGVLNREAMAALGPAGFAALNAATPGGVFGRGRQGRRDLAEFTDESFGIGDWGISPIISWTGFGQANAISVIQDAVRGMNNLLQRLAGMIPSDMFRKAFGITKWPLEKVRDVVANEVLAKAVAQSLGDIVAVGHRMQEMGYRVGEHPAFGGVSPVHVDGSYHYRGRAIDVNWDPASEEPARLDWLKNWIHENVHPVAELLWRVSGHYDHLHLAMARGGSGTVYGPTRFLAGEAGPEDFAFAPRSSGGLFGGVSSSAAPVVHVHLDGPIFGTNDAEVERVIVAALSSARRKGLAGA